MLKFILATILVTVTTISAQAGVLWAKAASSCFPDRLYFSDYATSFGALMDKTGVSHLVEAYCPVSSPIASPTSISIVYSDSSVASTDHVYATYYKMKRSTGALTSIATIDSKVSPCVTGTTKTCTVTFTDTIDFATYYYFVEANLVRDTSSVTETLFGVSLSD